MCSCGPEPFIYPIIDIFLEDWKLDSNWYIIITLFIIILVLITIKINKNIKKNNPKVKKKSLKNNLR